MCKCLKLRDSGTISKRKPEVLVDAYRWKEIWMIRTEYLRCSSSLLQVKYSRVYSISVSEMGLPKLVAKLSDLNSTSRSKFEEEKKTDWQSYDSWLKKHPSALDRFQKMMSKAEGKKIAVFLDYDGTLSPIVSDPEIAYMTNEMRSVVHEVGCCFPTSIISGRSRDKVYEFVQLDNIYYAGSHGMDIMAPSQPLRIKDSKYQSKAVDRKGNKFVICQPAYKHLPEIKKIQKSLKERTTAIEGVKIEDNKFCLSVHFRNVSDEDLSTLDEHVNSILEEHPHFRLTSGKKVLEIRPPVNWDKGHALEYLLDSLGLAGSSDVLPIYIGDDVSDEDAFELIHQKRQGYSIIVTSEPRETWASHSLYDTTEVMLFLEYLAKWKRSVLAS